MQVAGFACQSKADRLPLPIAVDVVSFFQEQRHTYKTKTFNPMR